MIKSISDSQLDKLPRWARIHIEGLCKEIKHLESEVSTLTGSVGSSTSITWSESIGNNKNLPDHSCIRFRFDKENSNDFSIIAVRVLRGPGKRTLRVEGYSPLQIFPSASNVVYISMMED